MKKSIDIIEKVLNTIYEYDMLMKQDRVVIGLSGGPDSICLFHILWKLRDEFDLMIFPVYVNHHLRDEDEIIREIEFIRNFVSGYGIELMLKDVDVKGLMRSKKLSTEEAGRELRYRALYEAMESLKAQKIATGHNANDQAETIIMRLVRGIGPLGMMGIPPVRDSIIRPLIEIKRREIEDYLYNERLDYIIDTTNLRKEYTRNRIRLVILPMMEEINPSLIETLSRTAKVFREEEEAYEKEASKVLISAIESKTEDEMNLSLSVIEGIEKRLLRRVIRLAIDKITGLRDIRFEHIESILHLIKNGNSGDRLYLPHNLRVIKSYSRLVLTLKKPVILGEYYLKIPGELYIDKIKKVIKACVTEKKPDLIGDGKKMIVIDYGSLSSDTLTIRPWRYGDFFYPLGFGKRKKLQDFFVDNKVPRDERYSIPLVLSNDDIIWIAGYRGDDRFKITHSTKRYVVLEMEDVT